MTLIAKSRKQRVFAVMETTAGTLMTPAGATDFIRPAGDAMMNQSPTFADSPEKRDTLDVLDQLQVLYPEYSRSMLWNAFKDRIEAKYEN